MPAQVEIRAQRGLLPLPHIAEQRLRIALEAAVQAQGVVDLVRVAGRNIGADVLDGSFVFLPRDRRPPLIQLVGAQTGARRVHSRPLRKEAKVNQGQRTSGTGGKGRIQTSGGLIADKSGGVQPLFYCPLHRAESRAHLIRRCGHHLVHRIDKRKGALLFAAGIGRQQHWTFYNHVFGKKRILGI